MIGADPLTATEILVDDGLGPIFTATPPFTVLFWPVQEVPVSDVNAEQAQNAEAATVTAVQDDVFTLTRGANPIPLISGLMIGQIAAQPVVDFGDVLALVDTIAGGVADYRLILARPDGGTAEVSGLPAASWGGSVGQLPVEIAGQYHYQFEDSHGKRSPLQDLFVKFDAL